jgi:serine phosphatase RsbU (regulator of sigma subunit)
MAHLVISGRDGSSKSIPLTKSVTLGRSTEADLCFPEDSGLSRQHLTIEPSGDRWTVRDLGSKNGTRVNGKLLQAPHVLDQHDQITASYLMITFRSSETPHERVVFDAAAHPVETLETHRTVFTSLERVLSQEGISKDTASAKSVWSTPARALLRAGSELSHRRPLDELFKVLLDLAMEAVGADRGVLMTLENGQLQIRASSMGEFRISSAVRDRVLQDRASMLIRSVADDAELHDRLSIKAHSVLSLIAAPLQLDERVIGLIYVDCSRVMRGFTEDDLNLLTVIGNIAAMRIEQQRLAAVEEAERRMQAELSQAAEIQRKHLPGAPPQIPGLEIASQNTPCRTVGGDYYDFVRFADGRIGIIIADVAGKGLPAALLMMSLQARVQALAEGAASLATFVARLNRSLTVSCPSNRFITMFVLALDPETGEFGYVNAGHNPSLLIRSNGTMEELSAGGMVLGLIATASYEETMGRLEPGDSLLLYTDGISEAESPKGEEYDLPRLRQLMERVYGEPGAGVITAIEREIERWTCGAPAADDRTLTFVRRTSGLRQEDLTRGLAEPTGSLFT